MRGALLPGNGDGTFKDQQRFAVGIDPLGVVSGDFNHDSRPDLAVANSNSFSLSILLNQLPPLPQPASASLVPQSNPQQAAPTAADQRAIGAAIDSSIRTNRSGGRISASAVFAFAKRAVVDLLLPDHEGEDNSAHLNGPAWMVWVGTEFRPWD